MGAVIDSFDAVIRLKRGNPAADSRNWGSRTDILCARSPRFDKGRYPFWLLDGKFYDHKPFKPTTGICAVVEAKRRLNPKEIFLIGFDRLMHPEIEDPPCTWLAHDKWYEHAMLVAMGVKELEQIC